MPSLAELTDFDASQSVAPDPDGVRRVLITTPNAPAPDGSSVGTDGVSSFSSTANSVLNSLFRDDDKRYQLWPEKVVREALSAAHDAQTEGTLPPGLRREDFTDEPVPNGFTVANSPADKIIGQAQAMSALAGTGGLGGTGAEAGTALGSSPFLRPALKYENKIYKAPKTLEQGGEHGDAIPAHLDDIFRQQAMSGEDISNFNFGFMNHKGQFLNREAALDYAIKEGLVDPSAGQYGALTSTMMADSSKPGTAIEAMAKTQPFYSALEHNVNQISQAKMTGDQWLGTLANKPGVKPEELQWTGVGEFLKEKGNQPVTKAELQEHLQNNKVEIKDVDKVQHKAEIKGWSELDGVAPTDTKYHSYQLPGGENYREKLLTLPRDKVPMEQHKVIRSDGHVDSTYTTAETANQRAAQIGGTVRQAESIPVNPEGSYKSSHWDEPNILAHVRMNDRNIDGKKSLHIEEIQSDWHQQGRDKGYKGDLRKLEQDGLEASRKKLAADEHLQKLTDGGLASAKDLDEAMKAARVANEEFKQISTKYQNAASGYVPDAPFKKTWHELALKRMIREAAEKGYDRLSWTPGEAQAARYDLSKQVNLVSGMKTGDKYNVYIEGKDGQPLFRRDNGWSDHGQKTMTEQELKDTVGKEAADKIINGKPNKDGWVDLRDDKLKIGGEGMKGFYDQIIPKAVEKISGQKVKQTNSNETKFGILHNDKVVSPKEGFNTAKEAREWALSNGWQGKGATVREVQSEMPKIHYIDIPQQLKDKAMGTGFPLFSSTHIFTPVAGNPFENKK